MPRNCERLQVRFPSEGSASQAVCSSITALNHIAPHTIRLRTFVPKVGTPLLHKVQKGRFVMAGSHDVLCEAKVLLETCPYQLA